MANSKEPVAWITVKGVRVPIFEGQSKEDAFKSFKERIGKRNSNQPTTQAEKKRVLKEYTNARNAAHNAKPDKQEKAGERFEKAKQKYSESKEKTAIKSATFTAPSDRDPANKTNNEFMRRENERYERERGKGTYQKEETQKQQRIEQARKTSSNPHERVESLAKRMENAKTEQEREAVRNDMDKAWKDIDHNKKLDDREKNHLESRLRDIYDKSKGQANIKKNEDEKEKQIARNEAEKKQAEKAFARGEISPEQMKGYGFTNKELEKIKKAGREEALQRVAEGKNTTQYIDPMGNINQTKTRSTYEKNSGEDFRNMSKSNARLEIAKMHDDGKTNHKIIDGKDITKLKDEEVHQLQVNQWKYKLTPLQKDALDQEMKSRGYYFEQGGWHKNSNSGFKTASEWDRESAPKIAYDESKAKSYKIASGGLNRASQAAADTMGQSLFKNGRADIVIKEENARDTTYSLRDKYGNEVGTFLQARTEKKGTGKLTLYGVKTASKQKTNKK